jgi:hypothetical protein
LPQPFPSFPEPFEYAPLSFPPLVLDIPFGFTFPLWFEPGPTVSRNVSFLSTLKTRSGSGFALALAFADIIDMHILALVISFCSKLSGIFCSF